MNKNPDDELILNHYKKVASNFGDSPNSTMADPYIREMEIKFFIGEISRIKKNNPSIKKVLDLGCGNAHLLSVLQETFPELSFYGLEFTPELLEIALNRSLPSVIIKQGDAREADSFTETFDIIITERVIINILTWEGQEKALRNISHWLNPNGHYLMVESFRESWEELNKGRKEMSLEEIPVSYQNRYLNERVIPILKDLHLEEIKGEIPLNYLSTHFYLSRIVHVMLKPDGGRGKNSRFVRFFDDALPPAVGNYSPILFRVFKKTDKNKAFQVSEEIE